MGNFLSKPVTTGMIIGTKVAEAALSGAALYVGARFARRFFDETDIIVENRVVEEDTTDLPETEK